VAKSRGFLRFGVENVLKFQLNTFWNTPKTSKGKKSNDFLKGRTKHYPFLASFPKKGEKLLIKKNSVFFLVAIHFHLSHPQPNP